MSTQDQGLHQVILRWPHTDANEVIVTGTFDQWSSSLRLSRKPDGFEAPVFIPWKDKIAYKFIVDGRWMTNDREPTEIDHGFVNNVYTAPSKPPIPEPQHAVVPHNESEVEPEHVETVPRHADKPVENGSALGESHEAPIHIAGPVPEKPSTIPDDVKQVVTSAIDAPHAATAQVAPEPQEVERASEEVAPDQAPKEPVHIAPADATEAEEPASASIPEPEPEATPDVDAAGVDGSVPVEKETSHTVDAESKIVAEAPAPAPVPEPEPATPAAVEPIPEPTKLEAAPVTESETVRAPEHGVPVAPTREEPADVPQPSAPASAVEQGSEPGKSTGPTPATESAAPAPEPKPDVKSSEAPSSPSHTAPPVSGHTKTASTASASTAAPTLPTTPSRKASRKFSFPGWDKSGNSSPTGSSRFSIQQKREKRHSLLGKLKEIFGDKEKKERKEKSAKA